MPRLVFNMKCLRLEDAAGDITWEQQRDLLNKMLSATPKKRRVLLVPPDGTRGHAMVGPMTRYLYRRLCGDCHVRVLPALGSHHAMTAQQLTAIFGDIPQEAFLVHNWRQDLVSLGDVDEEFISRVSDGKVCRTLPVLVSRHLLDDYDLIISLGQVVPHEVAGMANHSKNILVGTGGAEMIHYTHWIGALGGMEQAMGMDNSPARQVFDYASHHYLSKLPIMYLLTVVRQDEQGDHLKGLYIGDERDAFEAAVAMSQQMNITYLPQPAKKIICYLEPEEFTSTWVGNKAIYRSRMAVADGGELVILAPGVRSFGEDAALDGLIRKYGYRGTPATLLAVEQNADLQQNLSAAAHLIHGSSESRFTVTYAPGGLTEKEITEVGFNYLPYAEAAKRYPIHTLREGHNTINGESVYFIGNPALGLWKAKV